MKKWTTWSLVLALTFALWGSQDVQAQDEPAAAAPGFVDENGDGIDDNARIRHRRGHRGVMKRRGAHSQIQSLLTEEQQAGLKALVEGMKASEASGSDIRAAVEARLVAWEIERPERPERGLNALLDEAQEAEIKELIGGLKEAESSRTDVRAAVDAQLEAWGVERPERSGGKMGGKHGRRGGSRGFRGKGHGPAPEAPAAETSDSQ